MGSKQILYTVILIALWFAIFIASIARPALLDDADSFHAEAVREMVQSGDWVTLRINDGIRYLEKAPLMYWLAALSVTVFGLHDWSIRLPLALFSLLLIMLVFRFGTRSWGEKGGFYSGLVIATCLGHYAFTRIFLPDMIVSFFIAFCLYMYMQITIEEEEPKRIGPVDLRCAALYIFRRPGCADKGTDRHNLYRRNYFCSHPGNRKLESPQAASDRLRDRHFSDRCSPLACRGGPRQSGLSVVLFYPRASAALFWEALSQGL